MAMENEGYDPNGFMRLVLDREKEKDPLGKSAAEPGSKLDAGKAPIVRGAINYFPRAIAAVALLSLYGANKYTWKGWKSVPDGYSRYSDALGRHLVKEETEGDWDLEVRSDPKYPAEILHATQVAWNALARLELKLRDMQAVKFSRVDDHKYAGAGTLPVREQMDPVQYKEGEVYYVKS